MSTKQQIIKQAAWLSVFPHLFAMGAFIGIFYATGSNNPIIPGTITYLITSNVLRRIIPHAHNKGMQLLSRQNYPEAISNFEKSYSFFSGQQWLDKFRYLTLLSSSRMSYREMALINIAYCHAQMGNENLAKEFYEQTLAEFPKSEMAIASLNSFEAAEKSA